MPDAEATGAGRSFEVGSCVGRTFTVWARNALPFLLLSAIVNAPLLVWMLLDEPPDAGGFDVSETLKSCASLALGSLSAGPITYGVVQHLRGTPAPFGECLRVGLGRLLPVLGVGIVVGVLVTLGLMVLVFPGLLFLCIYWVAVPAAVLEPQGIGGALRRSSDLTRGRRWSVFGVQCVFFLVVLALFLLTWFVLLPGELDAPTRAGAIAEYLLAGVLWGSLIAVASAVGYHDLRREKEGTSAEQLARVFE